MDFDRLNGLDGLPPRAHSRSDDNLDWKGRVNERYGCARRRMRSIEAIACWHDAGVTELLHDVTWDRESSEWVARRKEGRIAALSGGELAQGTGASAETPWVSDEQLKAWMDEDEEAMRRFRASAWICSSTPMWRSRLVEDHRAHHARFLIWPRGMAGR
jgi:hypothetical protein